MSINKTTLTGASGEHLVMGQLLKRGFIAALAPQGAPNMDIVITDLEGKNLYAIQVKTRLDKGADGGWHMRPKHEELVSKNLLYVFVDLGKNPLDEEKYWIIPSKVVAQKIKHSHAAWLSQVGPTGRKRKDSTVRRLLPDYTKAYAPLHCPAPLGWMEKFKDNWEQFSE